MPKSLINGLLPEPDFYADVFSRFTMGQLFFDAQDWAEASPKGNRTSSITVTTEYTYQIHNKPDFVMDAGITFHGRFTKVDGDWSGRVTKIDFVRDDADVGEIQIRSGVDISRVMNVGSSGLIWNELTTSGLKGNLTSTFDYINGSLGDDIIFAGSGADSINASRGNDRIFGQRGSDSIDGYDGDDYINGGAGNDRMYGKGGSDTLLGGAGRDTFASDFVGDNVWTGGKGGDRFQVGGWNAYEDVSTRVTDFNKKQGDKLDLTELSELLYHSVDEVRYIGKRDFSGEDGVLEIRMENGFVELDYVNDGRVEYGLHLDGLSHFKSSQTNWILLPDTWDFS